MHEVTVEAKTVAQAIEKGLKEMGLRREQVEVSVVQEPSGGIFGLGAKQARVVLREKRWSGEEGRPPEADVQDLPPARPSARPEREARPPRDVREVRPASASGGGSRGERRGPGGRDRMGGRRRPPQGERPPRAGVTAEAEGPREPHVPSVPEARTPESEEAKAILQELAKLMGLTDATVMSGWDAAQGRVRAEVVTPDARMLTGRDGEVLGALQFLTTLAVNRKLKSQVAVQVDTEGFWKRKEESAIAQAQRALDTVKSSGRPFRMDPMDASLRRLVHRHLQDNADVETASEGEGAYRKVVVKPRRK